MHKPKTRLLLAAFIAAAASLPSLSPGLLAQNYVETGDAGQTPGTAQATGINQSGTLGSASTITGTFAANTSNGNNASQDADVFIFTLSAPAMLTFSTLNTTTSTGGQSGGRDTELFLFTSTGAPILANNDATGFTLQSSFTVSLAAGSYRIAVSLADNEPVNSANQLVFATSASPTAVRGPASGINPAVFSNFNSGNSFPDSGNYQIGITTVPEPSAWALMVLGAATLSVFINRRRRRHAA